MARFPVSDVNLPQQAQTIESISGHTYIRKRISLTFFVKKLFLYPDESTEDFIAPHVTQRFYGPITLRQDRIYI